MIFDDLKKANMEAMKNHDSVARGVYSVLINKCMLKGVELKAQGKALEDADTLSIINKTIKELDEEIDTYTKANRTEQANDVIRQKDLIKCYLPTLMSEEEITKVISALEDKSLKNVMIHFKTNYAGKADMKLVSEVAKKFN